MSRVYLKRHDGEAWHEVVTDTKDEVRFTFTFDNLENPTNYISESSVSLKLPRCPENNDYFGQFCRLDSVIVAGGYDPTRKMQYMVLDTVGMLISTGDAVISEINNDNYVLSLVGSQARLFRRLRNAGWDSTKAAEDNDYTLLFDWLKTKKSGNVFIEGENAINAALVYASWMVDKPLFNLASVRSLDLLQYYGLNGDAKMTETAAFIASLVGFAPTAQGKYQDFESDVWYEKGEVKVMDTYIPADNVECLPVLCSLRDVDDSPIKTIELEDGAVDVQMQEFRSYYMQPYVYITALWQLFFENCYRITGYHLVLDDRWFNANNANLRRLVYMLPQLSVETGSIIDYFTATAKAMGTYFPYGTVEPSDAVTLSSTPPPLDGDLGLMFETQKPIVTSTSGVQHLTKYRRNVLTSDIRVNFQFGWTMIPAGFEGMPLYFSGYNPFDITLSMRKNGTLTVVAEKKYLLFLLPTDGTFDLDTLTADSYIQRAIASATRDGYEVVTAGYNPISITSTLRNVFDVQLPIALTPTEDMDVVVDATVTTRFEFIPFAYNNNGIYYTYNRAEQLYMGVRIETGGYMEVASRSNSIISLERLFNGVTPFDILLKFTKEHGLLWLVDDNNKTVTVQRRADYFSALGITDISQNVDKGRQVKITPLSWEEHKVVLNLDAIDVDGVDGYDTRYGHDYGSKVIITANNLNKDEKKLLDGIKTSAMYSQTVAPCGVLKQLADASQASFVEVLPMPANVKEGESAGVSGNFYYRHDNKTWQAALQAMWHQAYITDDYYMEVWDNKYCWHGLDVLPDTGIAVAVCPVFSTVSDGGLSVLFAPVREYYTGTPDVPTTYLYEQHWQHYIEEVYNAQNKTVEVYIHLPRRTFDTVRSSPLVVIDHVLYLLTEIRSWGEHNTVCRCTLRQITNINNLTS